ncbi:type I polyketide synthase, partial [Amycolatopsis sp. cmx-4-68]|uniref:type I polyketide synthase n=1 Tax=Amycolatopsis sp. cmx-4-68 TaxID=2790938 RepID=UPI00397B9EE1
VELGPDTTLTTLVGSIHGETATTTPLLRPHQSETLTLTTALARAYADGAEVDWSRFYRGGRTVALPTYPYQRDRFWLSASVEHTADPAHPVLDEGVELADGQGTVFTGRLDPQAQPWLADHAIAGAVTLPGSAVAELALYAARRTGAGQALELAMEQPLLLGQPAAIQLIVGSPADTGCRSVALYARSGTDWTRHATGTLAAAEGFEPTGLRAWPPRDASPVQLDGLYSRLAGRGYGYGPAFQGLRRMWRHGADLYAEVVAPADARGDRYLVHPAVLDAALHPLLAIADDRFLVPFAWRDLVLAGDVGETLRIRLRRTGDSCAVLVADETGAPVLGAEIALRELPRAGGRPAQDSALYALEWAGRTFDTAAPAGRWAVLGPDAEDLRDAMRAAGATVRAHARLDELLRSIDDGADVPAVVVLDLGTASTEPDRPTGTGLHEFLALVHRWLLDERFDGGRLVVLTRDAVAASDGDRPDPVRAALWGLVRVAQSERPGRFTVIDTDGRPESVRGLALAIESDEPQVAIRHGCFRVPRLGTYQPRPTSTPPFDAESRVLITGGLGTLGRLVARHLADRYGVRQLVLTGHRGLGAPNAPEFVAELEGAGVHVTVAACDVADRSAVTALLDGLEQPPTAVLHAAGVLDDTLIEDLTPPRLDAVLQPKLDGAIHLHELTRHLDLSAFVLFSSLAGVLGSRGQGNYAAASSALDALAHRRRAAGLPAVSLAWGPWTDDGASGAIGLGSDLDNEDLRALSRFGVATLPAAEGLALFDVAVVDAAPALVPARLDLVGLDPEHASPVLRALAPRRTAAVGTPEPAAALRDRLAGVPRTEQLHIVLEAVRTEVAVVLGLATSERVATTSRFQDLGFDSLTALELRNRLSKVTGIPLPPTLIFDHAGPRALADRIAADLAIAPAEPPVEAEPADGPGAGSAVDSMTTDELVRLALGRVDQPPHRTVGESP